MTTRKEDALNYHSEGRPGKIEVVPTKPTTTARDLSLAYSPGVAEPCLEIEKDPDLSYRYTARGNLVGVVSNGTAVLGLGNIGPFAAKPVMEGKGVLFKKFADIDVFDICVSSSDIDHFCTVVKALEPTFGGINLEDIKAPECFVIEARLKEEMEIPVFHDDQHGTAIISGAALLNAAEIIGKSLDSLRVVVSGAGASAIACTRFWITLGVKAENVLMCDSRGVLHPGRTDLNEWKMPFVRETSARSLADAMKGADVFLGTSVKGVLTQDMVRTMGAKPIIFALANPDPEIPYDEAKAARPDAIVATGRSDFPNQVNNVLGFPFIFRGALDVRARAINDEMKLAAARALAALAKEDVPDSVVRAYGGQHFTFGTEYIIPKPFDPRVLLWVAPAVATAAIKTGVARKDVDIEAYRESLHGRQSASYSAMSSIFTKARQRAVRILLDDGEDARTLHAASVLREERLCEPVLLGRKELVEKAIIDHRLEDELTGVQIVDPTRAPELDRYVHDYWQSRERKGMTQALARKRLQLRGYFGAMMLREGDVDGFVTGVSLGYREAVRPPLEVIGAKKGRRVGGVYLVVRRNAFVLFADCTMNPEPSAEHLAEIAIATADLARYFDVTPRVAFLSYSNFGNADGPEPQRVREAVRRVRTLRPSLEVDGEMQVDPALLEEERASLYPFSTLKGPANVLIFPNLAAANIGYKLLWRFGGAEVVGPLLLGMGKPVNVLQENASADDIVQLAAVTAVQAQDGEFSF
ncbi:MAG: NADP-dependent malic enzyme [Myxococcales bacterium]|nr:NADP-dependent malic enzyme [Myxococcales bacterium]